MAIANLNETIMAYKLRRNELNDEIASLQGKKRLVTYEQTDYAQLVNAQKSEAKSTWKTEYEKYADTTYADISSYTEIDEYIDEVDKIEADYEIYTSELTAWETDLDSQITTTDTELSEVEAYLESYESMLSNNITNDFDYGL